MRKVKQLEIHLWFHEGQGRIQYNQGWNQKFILGGSINQLIEQQQPLQYTIHNNQLQYTIHNSQNSNSHSNTQYATTSSNTQYTTPIHNTQQPALIHNTQLTEQQQPHQICTNQPTLTTTTIFTSNLYPNPRYPHQIFATHSTNQLHLILIINEIKIPQSTVIAQEKSI